MTILAHGMVGILDEVLYIGIAIVFTIFIAVSWWRSRGFEPEMEESEPTPSNEE